MDSSRFSLPKLSLLIPHQEFHTVRAIVKVFTTGQARVNPAHCNQMYACGWPITFPMLMWLLSLAVCCSRSIKPYTHHFSTLFLLNFCTIEYLVYYKILFRAWVADYFPPHHMLFLSTIKLGIL